MEKIKTILKNSLVRDIITNTIYAILVIMYIICFNTQGSILETNILIKYIDISSITFLSIAIIFLEMGYRKDISKIFINGLEFLVLAIATLLIKHIPKVTGYSMNEYTEVIAYAFVAYYILKSAIMYTIKKHKELKQLSDIKEIVKDEPTKKETKRKNKKVESVEEGN